MYVGCALASRGGVGAQTHLIDTVSKAYPLFFIRYPVGACKIILDKNTTADIFDNKERMFVNAISKRCHKAKNISCRPRKVFNARFWQGLYEGNC